METMRERLGTDAIRTGVAEPTARGLGWFSLALGVPQVVAPRAVSRLAGAPGGTSSAWLARAVGARELGAGLAILVRRSPTAGLWSRVAGDAMDLGLLAAAMASPEARRLRLLASMGVVGGITAVDVVTATRTPRAEKRTQERLVAAATVNRPRQEVYEYWRDFGRLPEFMAHLERVDVDADGEHSHWVARAPAGRSVERDAQITEEVPGEAIAWSSGQGTAVDHTGRVEFADAPGGGTEVLVFTEYAPPAAALGKTLAMMFGEEPHQQVRDDLRRFKQVMETGEVVRSEGSPEGILSRRQVRQQPAQPEQTQQPRRAA